MSAETVGRGVALRSLTCACRTFPLCYGCGQIWLHVEMNPGSNGGRNEVDPLLSLGILLAADACGVIPAV